MSRLKDERLHQARRVAIRNTLVSTGMDVDLSERWCNAWEAEAMRHGLLRDSAYFWDAGRGWIDAQRRPGRRPAVIDKPSGRPARATATGLDRSGTMNPLCEAVPLVAPARD